MQIQLCYGEYMSHGSPELSPKLESKHFTLDLLHQF